MHFDFFVSNYSVASYDVHRKATFFRGASGDLLSLAQFSVFCNENLGKYCSNVALLYGHWLNELILSVSPKKILNAFVLLVSKIVILKVTYFYTGGIGFTLNLKWKVSRKVRIQIKIVMKFDDVIITSSDELVKKFVLFVFELFSPKVVRNECVKLMKQISGNVAIEQER